VLGVSGAGESNSVIEEVRALVEVELARLGQRGIPKAEGSTLVLGSARVDIVGTVAQWENLPDDLRQRRLKQIAELLLGSEELAPARAQPAKLAPAIEMARRATPRADRPGLPAIAWALIVGGLSVLALGAAFRLLAPGSSLFSGLFTAPSASAAPTVRPDPEQERAGLATNACEQARARVARGANIGPADVEGWVVELVLARENSRADLAHLPGLAKFIRSGSSAGQGSVVWAHAPNLTSQQRFDANVKVGDAREFVPASASGLSFVFSGPYVVPYFTEAQRSDYFALADALAEELGATDGALFARCESGQAHHIGAWFLGGTPGKAMASLIYFMSAFADAPLLKPEVLRHTQSGTDWGGTFDAIRAASADLDRGTSATLIGNEMGMISGRPGHPTRLTFPFRDANRASRASLAAARSLRLANSG